MTACPGCGWPHFPGRLAEALWALDAEPEAAARVADHVLIALDRWAGGRHAITRAEVRRRHDYHAQMARWFAGAQPGGQRTTTPPAS